MDRQPTTISDPRVVSRLSRRKLLNLVENASGRSEKLGRLTPRGIRTHLGLNKPIYQATAAYGHFGRKAEGELFPWERVDLVDDLKAAVAA